jgi:hypothetical protein
MARDWLFVMSGSASTLPLATLVKLLKKTTGEPTMFDPEYIAESNYL